ncbi:hypothetical protein [Streptomyces sp. NPDC059015]|uniref:hypothetical protein n=1 Tax=unclassified Streptomyces TaxID=2593676 RepID=UPI0036B4FEE7
MREPEIIAAEYEAHAALDEATDTDPFSAEWPDLYWYAKAALRARDALWCIRQT